MESIIRSQAADVPYNMTTTAFDLPGYRIVSNLGVVRVDQNRSFVVADIPGLIEGAADGAGIGDRFLDIVSVDEIGAFKPDPAVYRHFLERASAPADAAWLISGNPFDVIGAVSAGMRAAWVRRSDEAPFDPWEVEPTLVVNSLTDLQQALRGYTG